MFFPIISFIHVFIHTYKGSKTREIYQGQWHMELWSPAMGNRDSGPHSVCNWPSFIDYFFSTLHIYHTYLAAMNSFLIYYFYFTTVLKRTIVYLLNLSFLIHTFVWLWRQRGRYPMFTDHQILDVVSWCKMCIRVFFW